MALGAQEDGANGPTSTDQQPLLHRRLSQRAPFESLKDQQAQQRTRPSPQPGNEYSKAPHQHRPQARFPRVQALLKAARRLSSASSGFTAVGLRVRGSSATVAAQSNFQAAGLLVAVGAATAAAVSSFTASAGQVYYGAALIEAISDVSANGRRKWRPESNATTSWAVESAANNPWTSQTNASTAWQEAA